VRSPIGLHSRKQLCSVMRLTDKNTCWRKVPGMMWLVKMVIASIFSSGSLSNEMLFSVCCCAYRQDEQGVVFT
jgi:hypothetical protein